MKKQDIGQNGEGFVCERMQAEGFQILDRNIRFKFGELDIVAKENDILCFVEVRTREDSRMGHPLETISLKKQKTIRRAAEFYLLRRNITNQAIRFDVAYIVWSTMEYGYLRDVF